MQGFGRAGKAGTTSPPARGRAGGHFLSASPPPLHTHLDLLAEMGSLMTGIVPNPHPLVPAQTLCSIKSCLEEGMDHPGPVSR